MKNLKLFCTTIMLLVLCSCKNNAQTKNETPSSSVTQKDTKRITETVKNANRLTEASLSSYFPTEFLGQKYNGETYKNTSKPNQQTGGVHYRLTQLYGEVGDITIEVADYADDQQHINLMQQYGKKESARESEFLSSKTYKYADGIYIYESLERYNGKLRRSSLVVSNPRFDIVINSSNQKIKAYAPVALLQQLKETNLFALFQLPIPEGESPTLITQAQNSTKKTLNCDDLLPISAVKSICNKTVTIKTGSFEKDDNCNRYYPDKNSSGSLIFLVTQYSKASTAKSAVKIDEGKKIANLGDVALYFKIGDDEYLKVGYQNYVLELRSTKNFGKEGVCYTEKELIKLMKGVINRLQ